MKRKAPILLLIICSFFLNFNFIFSNVAPPYRGDGKQCSPPCCKKIFVTNQESIILYYCTLDYPRCMAYCIVCCGIETSPGQWIYDHRTCGHYRCTWEGVCVVKDFPVSSSICDGFGYNQNILCFELCSNINICDQTTFSECHPPGVYDPMNCSFITVFDEYCIPCPDSY